MERIERERFRPVATPQGAGAAVERFQARAAPTRPAEAIAPTSTTRRTPNGPNTTLGPLLEGLGQLNSNLGTAAGLFFAGQRQQDEQSATADAEEMAIRQMDVATWGQAVAINPGLVDRSPYYRQVFSSRMAVAAVQRQSNRLFAEYHGSEIAGSTDPTAIQGWMGERLRETLSQFEGDAGARAAAAGELRNQVQGFVRMHAERASRNLVQQNEDSIETRINGSIDSFVLRGGAGRNTSAVSVPDGVRAAATRAAERHGIPVDVLLSIGAVESGNFDPAVLNGSRRGSRGEVGVAQVLPGTAANPGYGVAPITEEGLRNPETSIDFMARYLAARGRSAGVRDWNDPAQRAVGIAAYNGSGEQARRYAQTVEQRAAEFRRGTGTPIPGSADPVGLAAELEAITQEARAQGVAPARLNMILARGVASAALRHGRMDVLDLGLVPRADGTPGFGTTLEGRNALEAARNQILSRSLQQQNLAYTMERRAAANREDNAMTGLMGRFIQQGQEGTPVGITPEVMRDLLAAGPGAVERGLRVQSAFRSANQEREDPRRVAVLTEQVDTGRVTAAQLVDLHGNGWTRIETYNRLRDRALEVGNASSVINSPLFMQFIRSTQESALGVESNGLLRLAGGGDVVAAQISNDIVAQTLSFIRDNPTARTDPGRIYEMLRTRQESIVGAYRRDANFPANSVPATLERGGRVPAAAPPAQPDGATPARATRSGAAVISPAAGANWRSQPAFSSVQELDQAWQRYGQNPTDSSNPITAWVARGGVTAPAEFYRAQQRLLSRMDRGR